MKTKYAVTREGQVLVESDDLKYIERMKKELEYRRTGRTTRMLFQVFGNPSTEIVVICRNRVWAKQLGQMAAEMLSKLEFEVYYNPMEGKVTNFGRTYYFKTRDELAPARCKKDIFSKMVKYLDED